MPEPTLDPSVDEHYRGEIDEDARLRRGLGRLEYARVQQIVRAHLPTRPLRIIDIGGATGVHAEWLLNDGHSVHLVEPVPSQVEQALVALGERTGFSAAVGDARALDVPDAAFDAALVFGPLYHLWDPEERLSVWREAFRAVGAGGLVFAMGVSRFASLFDGLAQGFLFDPGFRAIVSEDLASGRHQNPGHHPGWFTKAYFHAPGEMAAEAEASGLGVRRVVGVEGIAAWLPSLAERCEDPFDLATLVDAAARVEEEPGLIGLSAHHIVVAARP